MDLVNTLPNHLGNFAKPTKIFTERERKRVIGAGVANFTLFAVG
jgi:hypothetical protein